MRPAQLVRAHAPAPAPNHHPAQPMAGMWLPSKAERKGVRVVASLMIKHRVQRREADTFLSRSWRTLGSTDHSLQCLHHIVV
jgi:hypothetical protein